MFLLAASLIVLLVVVNVLLTLRSARALKDDAAAVSHSYQVIAGLNNLLSVVKDAETEDEASSLLANLAIWNRIQPLFRPSIRSLPEWGKLARPTPGPSVSSLPSAG